MRRAARHPLVAHREGAAITVGKCDSGGFAFVLYHDVAQSVRPCQRGFGDPVLNGSEVYFGAGFGVRVDDYMHTSVVGAEICTWVSTLWPLKPSSTIFSMRWRTSVLYRSRGRRSGTSKAMIGVAAD